MTCWLCGFENTELATNTEALTCENGPCQVCIAVAKLDEEINQATANLRRLISKRCDLRSEQNRVHGTLMHRLPVELKNHIFEYLLPSRDAWGEILRTKGPNRAVMSYFICRDWRDIAWSNPSLWSTIHIKFGTQDSISDPSNRINFMQDWILRSQTLPLTLCISLDKREEMQRVIHAVIQCSNRWHSLSLSIPSTRSLLHAFRFSTLHCPLLRRLRIRMNRSQGNIDRPFRSIQTSWNHLSIARVDGFNLEEIAQLFQSATQMTYCHIFCPMSLQNVSIPLITHRRLEILRIYTHDTAIIATLFRSLTLPRLQECHVNELVFLTPTYLPALVHRSSCPLTRVTFSFFSGTWRDFDDLQPFPGVTELVLINLESQSHTTQIEKLLLEDYFPHMRHLILERDLFLTLWDLGIVSRMLDRNRPRHHTAIEGSPLKILVVDPLQGEEFIRFWNSDMVREKLEARQARIGFIEDGFEILTSTNENSELVVCWLGSRRFPLGSEDI